jgi:hypothetical protein
MTKEVTIKLPDSLYRRTQEFADLHRQDVANAITTLIEQGLAGTELQQDDLDWTTPDAAVERERTAYYALHPQLVKSHLGKYVAIYGGKLIDSDDSGAALYERVKRAHAGEFVWLTQVRLEPMRTISMRSPKVERHD